MALKDLESLRLLRYDFDAFKDFCQSASKIYDMASFHAQLELPTIPDFRNNRIDHHANPIIPDNINYMNALRSNGNGNCLFNSISIMLNGTESLATELRVRTCIELALNRNFYRNHPTVSVLEIPSLKENGRYQSLEAILDTVGFGRDSSTIYESTSAFEPAFDNEIGSTAENFRSCGILQIMALATVIGSPIKTVYPEKEHQFFQAYDTLIVPRVDNGLDRTFTIMWSNLNGCYDKTVTFRANHFVPLIDKNLASQVKVLPLRISKCERNSRAKIDSFFQPVDQVVETEETILSDEINTHIYQREFDVEEFDDIPLTMPKEWYSKLGKNVSSNNKRDSARHLSFHGQITDHDPVRSGVEGTLQDAIHKVRYNVSKCKSEETRKHLKAIGLSAQFLLSNGPVVETQAISEIYRKAKDLNTAMKEPSKSIFERLGKFLPICQIYINHKVYILEDRLNEATPGY